MQRGGLPYHTGCAYAQLYHEHLVFPVTGACLCVVLLEHSSVVMQMQGSVTAGWPGRNAGLEQTVVLILQRLLRRGCCKMPS
jgi:hypothetical protein